MLHVITTRSTFENVYIVEADTEAEAITLVQDEYNPPNYLQKHLGEKVYKTYVSPLDYNETYKQIDSEGYW